MANLTDEHYIEKTLKGDANAFAYLIDRYKDMVFTLAIKMVKSREEAEEVSQDSFIKAFRSLDKFKGDSKFSTWLYKIVYNNCMDLVKKKARRYDTGTIDDSEFLAQDGQPPAVDSNDYKNAYNTNASGEHTHNISIDAVGGNKPHNNMPPYLVMNYIIRC